MLQRAASNAYSWWWASHIRTKQSKWLEQSLQDMEEKVQGMLKLIEEDGDSFAKRAEMYYKRRPELISSVEESYKAFRALADRYDLLSKDFQNANHTIATVFPEQVQYMDDDFESTTAPKLRKSPPNPANIPKVPKAPNKDLKNLLTTASRQLKSKKSFSKPEPRVNKVVVKSGLTKDEAVEEIDKIQKEILALQTVKEFVKSSYETGLAKYWEIDNQIMEMQQKASSLQDEFNVVNIIEDDEARTLMAEAAIRSCQETIAQLQERQEKSTREAREEYKKIEATCQRLKSLKQKFQIETDVESAESTNVTQDEETENEPLKSEKSEVKMDFSLIRTLTVSELAEKIDELVSKVINLESAVSSQTALIETLRTESDDLHAHIRNLENENETLIDGTHNLSSKVKEMEEKMAKIHVLNKNVERTNSNLQTDFAEARFRLDHLSEKLSSVKPDEEQDEKPAISDSSPSEEIIPKDIEIQNTQEDDEDDVSLTFPGNKEEKEDVKEVDMLAHVSESLIPKQEVEKAIEQSEEVHVNNAETEGEKEEELNLQQLLVCGMEDREKILLKEYTSILRNYKDVKKKLIDLEKKEKDSQFDATVQMREQKQAILKRDEVIQRLRQILSSAKDSTQEEERDIKSEDLVMNDDFDNVSNKEVEEPESVSIVEEKLRTDIDAILDENLSFWLRFSTAFHEVQKFENEVQDLQDEIRKLKEKKRSDGSIASNIKSEVRPIYKHLREIQTELTVWLEQSVSLKEELKRRFASLCGIQEEITKALKEGVEEDEIRFSSHQAAKFQGEILNMKQENNKVREELQSGLDHVTILQLEIEKTLKKLNEDFGVPSDQTQWKQSISLSKVPLRSFIFGTKSKKQKQSIFSCMHPNRKYQVLRGGVLLSNNP